LSAEPNFRRNRAPALQRLLLKIPPLIYAGPVAELLKARCVMRLTTRGRKTGRARTIGISFMPHGENFIIFAGFRGVDANWYRNVRATPEVRIKVGRRETNATAHVVDDPEERRQLMLQMQRRSAHCGPPRSFRPLLRLAGLFDYDAEIAMAVNAGSALPVVEVVPSERKQ